MQSLTYSTEYETIYKYIEQCLLVAYEESLRLGLQCNSMKKLKHHTTFKLQKKLFSLFLICPFLVGYIFCAIILFIVFTQILHINFNALCMYLKVYNKDLLYIKAGEYQKRENCYFCIFLLIR